MKTTILALAAVATLGMAVPAFAQETPRAAVTGGVQAQDFSSSHRHWGWRRHHHRHHGWCRTYWRHGHRVTVC
jgi:hypothetical protein